MKVMLSIIQIILVVILIGSVFLLLTSNNKTLTIRSLVVLTGSMEPNIPQGSMILVAKQRNYNLGDIITFEHTGRTITHRVVKIQKNPQQLFITKGDANNETDTYYVKESDIKGKVFLYIPYIGRFALFLKTFFGFFFFVIIPGLVFIISELYILHKKIIAKIKNQYLPDSTVV